jgi:hypothetical protein
MRNFYGILAIAVFGLAPLSVQSQSNPNAVKDGASKSPALRTITGPARTMNQAIAAGATATVTLQPVPPKTVPASNYPPGSAIMGQTMILGSVPARVWLEGHVTGWAPDVLDVFQITIDALDVDQDGGGFRGDRADCDGLPMQGAGDLTPAIAPCNGGTCQGNPMVTCIVSNDCTNAGTTGPCVGAHDMCRAALSGITSSCNFGEPSRCRTWDGTSPGNYFPPGTWCEPVFFNRCDTLDATFGVVCILGVDISTLDFRWGGGCEPGEVPIDHQPSHEGIVVLDIPANAKGRYFIDFKEDQTFLQNTNNPPNNNIPVAALQKAVIQVECGSCCTDFSGQNATCTDGLGENECDAIASTNAHVYRPGNTCDQAECCNCTTIMDCQDNDVCTVDACQDACFCTHTPVAGWNPATECCHPMSGAQSPIPQSTSCRIGGCNLGGSSGSPTYSNLPDATPCESADPCYFDGQCSSGQCMSDQYAGSDCPKSRFISFDISTGSTPSAYRLRLVSLHHPDPPYTADQVADFSAFEGEYRWVGAPETYIESNANPTPVYAAFTGCNPHYQDWSSIDLLHVSGAEVVPSSAYEVQSIADGLDTGVESNYSAPLTIVTARWGDVVIPYHPPSTTTQPDAGDMSALVDKFRSTPRSGSKPRALLTGEGAESARRRRELSDIPPASTPTKARVIPTRGRSLVRKQDEWLLTPEFTS